MVPVEAPRPFHGRTGRRGDFEPVGAQACVEIDLQEPGDFRPLPQVRLEGDLVEARGADDPFGRTGQCIARSHRKTVRRQHDLNENVGVEQHLQPHDVQIVVVGRCDHVFERSRHG